MNANKNIIFNCYCQKHPYQNYKSDLVGKIIKQLDL